MIFKFAMMIFIIFFDGSNMTNIINNINSKDTKRTDLSGGSLDPGDQANQPDPLFDVKMERLMRGLGAENPASMMKILGLTSGALSSARKTRRIPAQWLVEAFEKHGVSSDWVMSGAGPVRKQENIPHAEDEFEPRSFSERLVWLITELAGGKPVDFARRAGIPAALIYPYTEGIKPPDEHLIGIRDAYGVDLEWLLMGKGKPFLSDIEKGIAHQADYVYNMPEPDYMGPVGARISSGLDADFLQFVIEQVDIYLNARNLQHKYDKKAQLIAQIYDIGMKETEKDRRSKVESLLKLLT